MSDSGDAQRRGWETRRRQESLPRRCRFCGEIRSSAQTMRAHVAIAHGGGGD